MGWLKLVRYQGEGEARVCLRFVGRDGYDKRFRDSALLAAIPVVFIAGQGECAARLQVFRSWVWVSSRC